ncbi:MAG: hypothetical protein NTU78_09210 [Alphaproteobacteria bacterium]|nr:hypothetical protein [Alphaproteobacteria bacterium]
MTDKKKTDDTDPIKPQVIDLNAEDVTVDEEPRPADPPPVQPAPAARKAGSAKWIALALLLGVAGGAWAYRDMLSAYLPSNAVAALQARVEVLEANGRTQADQIAVIDQSAGSAGKLAAGLEQSVKDSVAAAAEAKSGMAALGERLAANEQALTQLRGDLDALRTAASKGTGTGGTVDNSALVALGQRIDALEKDMASLKAGSGKADAAASTAALSQALSDLKAKVAAGVPYNDEYERIARMVPAAAGLDILALNADAGLPDAAGLAAELRAAIPALPQPAAAEAAKGGGYLDWAFDMLSGIVTVRDIGESDWPQLAEKAAALAEAGDLPQAIDVIDQAEGAKPAALSNWRDRAAGRLALLAALDQVDQAVLRQIAQQGGAQ